MGAVRLGGAVLLSPHPGEAPAANWGLPPRGFGCVGRRQLYFTDTLGTGRYGYRLRGVWGSAPCAPPARARYLQLVRARGRAGPLCQKERGWPGQWLQLPFLPEYLPHPGLHFCITID